MATENEILIPFMSPIKFVKIEPEKIPQYLSRHMDEWLYENTLEDFNTPSFYHQKWQTSDTIPLQFSSTFASIQIQLIDCEMNVYMTMAATQLQMNKFEIGKYLYEFRLALNSVYPGTYWWLLNLGGGAVKMISEPQDIREIQEGTCLLEYKSPPHHGDVVFLTGIEFAFRIECYCPEIEFGTERTAYRDQRWNPSVLKATPWRGYTFLYGKDYGIPDWAAHTLNWIWSCNDVHADGKPYAVTEDSSFDAQEIDPVYKMRRWTLQVEEGINRSSLRIGVEVDTNKRLLIVLPIDNTLFGEEVNPGGNIINILDIE